MSYPIDAENKKHADPVERSHSDRNGKDRIKSSADDQIPRIKGLIELLNQYFSNKAKN